MSPAADDSLTANSDGKFRAGVPFSNVSVQNLGFGTTDPIGSTGYAYTAVTWSRDPATGNPVAVHCFGGGHGGGEPNMLRGYDFLTDQWVIFQSDTSAGYPENDDTYITPRNNHAHWPLPWDNKVWVVAGLTQILPDQPMNHGIMDLTQNDPVNTADRLWTHLWDVRGDFGETVGLAKGTLSNDLIRGKSLGIFGNVNNPMLGVSETCRALVQVFGGGPSVNSMAIVEPWNEGPESYVVYERDLPDSDPNYPPRCNYQARHGGVCVNDHFYAIAHAADFEPSRSGELWRLHIPTRQWTRLSADCPNPTDFGVLAYGRKTNQLVYYGGGNTNQLLVYDIATGQWLDYTAEAELRYFYEPCGTYDPDTDKFFFRGGRGDDGTAADGETALTLSERLTPEFVRLVNTGVSVDDILTFNMTSGEGSGETGPSAGKHQVYSHNISTGRLMAAGGDYDPGGSYQNQIWETDLANAIAGDQVQWTLVKGRCPPDDTTPYWTGACMHGRGQDPDTGLIYIAGGEINQNNATDWGSIACGVPLADVNDAWMMTYDPSTGQYGIPTQSAPPDDGTIGFWEFGFFDQARKKFGIWKRRNDPSLPLAFFDLDTGNWSIQYIAAGELLWAGSGQNIRGRKAYFIREGQDGDTNETGYLYEVDLDSLTATKMTRCPYQFAGNEYRYGTLVYWWLKDVLVYHPYHRDSQANTFYICDPNDNFSWQTKTVSPPQRPDGYQPDILCRNIAVDQASGYLYLDTIKHEGNIMDDPVDQAAFVIRDLAL